MLTWLITILQEMTFVLINPDFHEHIVGNESKSHRELLHLPPYLNWLAQVLISTSLKKDWDNPTHQVRRKQNKRESKEERKATSYWIYIWLTKRISQQLDQLPLKIKLKQLMTGEQDLCPRNSNPIFWVTSCCWIVSRD